MSRAESRLPTRPSRPEVEPPTGPQDEPRRLGQYALLAKLGEGGMGQVFKAVHTVMRREVALKILSPELLRQDASRDWFLREVRAATRLNHPNIALAYDANEADGSHFLVLEYVDGPTLEALVRGHGPMPWRLACRVFREVATGLQSAHDQGVIHRDVKPSNLLLPRAAGLFDARGWKDRSAPVGPLVKVVDFGLARLHGAAASNTLAQTTEGGFLGTPDYVAPEQARDVRGADARSDLYSLGCTLYFALAGRPPFPDGSAVEKLLRHISDEPVPVEAGRRDLPQALGKIVRRLMAKAPDDRFTNAEELAAILGLLCDVSSIDPPDADKTRFEVVTPVKAAPEPAPRRAAPKSLLACGPASRAELVKTAGAGLPPGLAAVSLSEFDLDSLPEGSLAPAEAELLPGVASERRQAEAALGGRRRSIGWGMVAACVTLGMLPLLAVSVWDNAVTAAGNAGWPERLTPSFTGLRTQLEANPLLWLTVVLPAAVALSLAVLGRRPRA